MQFKFNSFNHAFKQDGYAIDTLSGPIYAYDQNSSDSKVTLTAYSNNKQIFIIRILPYCTKTFLYIFMEKFIQDKVFLDPIKWEKSKFNNAPDFIPDFICGLIHSFDEIINVR